MTRPTDQARIAQLEAQVEALMGVLDRLFGASVSQRIDASLISLHGKVDRLMATVNQVNVIVEQINTATNDVAAKVEAQTAELQRLRDAVANGDGVTPADLDSIIAGLEPISSRLHMIAADPVNPVPFEPAPIEGSK